MFSINVSLRHLDEMFPYLVLVSSTKVDRMFASLKKCDTSLFIAYCTALFMDHFLDGALMF